MDAHNDPRRPVGEDEMMLAEMEGAEAARATVAYARERRRRSALDRWGQVRRIAQVFEQPDLRAYEDVRMRVLYDVIGYVHEHVWRDALHRVRQQLLDERDWEGWRVGLDIRLRTLADVGVRTYTTPDLNFEALFERDAVAIGGMTMSRNCGG